MRITSRQLRQIIREELIREAVPENDAFKSSEARMLAERRKKIGDAMTKTNTWFKNNIFPAVEYDMWSPPIVADQDYLIEPNDEFKNPLGRPLVDPNTAGIYIPKGTTFDQKDGEYPLSYQWGPPIPANYGVAQLREMYSMLEKAAIKHDLPVPMESFPD